MDQATPKWHPLRNRISHNKADLVIDFETPCIFGRPVCEIPGFWPFVFNAVRRRNMGEGGWSFGGEGEVCRNGMEYIGMFFCYSPFLWTNAKKWLAWKLPFSCGDDSAAKFEILKLNENASRSIFKPQFFSFWVLVMEERIFLYLGMSKDTRGVKIRLPRRASQEKRRPLKAKTLLQQSHFRARFEMRPFWFWNEPLLGLSQVERGKKNKGPKEKQEPSTLGQRRPWLYSLLEG